MVLVKIVGGVSAVKSAVDAACVAAERVSQIVSKHIIARPSDELDKIINVEEETQEEIIDNSEEQNEVIENNETDEVNEILEEIKEIQVVKGSKKHKNKK